MMEKGGKELGIETLLKLLTQRTVQEIFFNAVGLLILLTVTRFGEADTLPKFKV